MPVVNDEYGYIGDPQKISTGTLAYTRTGHRQIIWGIATAGGYGSTADSQRLANGEIPWLSADWKDEPGEYSDIERLISFFTNQAIPYWQMTSTNTTTTSNRVYVLAQTGKEYVAYTATGGPLTLTLPTGNYQTNWYNPTTGQTTTTTTTTTTNGGNQTLTPPFTGDAVLHLKSL